MSRVRRIALLLPCTLAIACGSAEPPLAPLQADPPNPDPTLTGNFYGVFNALDGTVMLAATVRFTLAESPAGSVVGTFGIEGVLDDGARRAEVSGTGTLAGSAEPGDRAVVSFTTSSDLCAHSSDFSGVYDRGTGVLGVDGTVHVLDQFCTVVQTYPISMAMRR
jgi:hypothetical protein